MITMNYAKINAIFRRFHDALKKAKKIYAADKLARRKERNLALSKGKHNLKRPK